jgi:hypothetical protein
MEATAGAAHHPVRVDGGSTARVETSKDESAPLGPDVRSFVGPPEP